MTPDKPPSPRPSATKVNALLTALDALRADVEELGREYEREREHTRDLESRLADLTDDFHRVMDEDCESDLEKHCACVPHLRRRIKELEAERDSWREQALDAQQVAIDTEVRLGLRVEQLERALRVEEVEAERDSARIRGINGERERIVSCIEKVIGSSVTDGGMYLADIESALNAWADALWEKIVAERDEARRQRDRLVRVIAVSRGKVAP